MKEVRLSTPNDYLDWLELAKEVEPLFGPMVDDPIFCDGLMKAILEANAFCVTDGGGNERISLFHGGIVISKETNEIVWLAVTQQSRGKKIGAALLHTAVKQLDHTRPITVTTFDQKIEAGIPARRLYQSVGFHDSVAAGLNPAGIPTVTMTLIKQNANE